MKLHYSQTILAKIQPLIVVLLPYEITLFSNAYEVVDTVPNGFTTL